MKFRPSGIRRLIAVLILLFVGSSAHALEQMQNASFTSNTSNWNIPSVINSGLTNLIATRSESGILPTGAINKFTDATGSYAIQSFLIYGDKDKNNPSPGIGSATLNQNFGPLSSQANAEINFAYSIYKYFGGATNKAWSISIDSNVTSGTAKIGPSIFTNTWSTSDKIYSVQWQDATPTSWTARLDPGITYSMNLSCTMQAKKSGSSSLTQMGVWFDRVYVNISPQGLTATETYTEANNGSATLSWPASTCPTDVPQLASYSIYRQKSDSSWDNIATITAQPSPTWSDATLGGTTLIATYCITDLDTRKQESPKSVEAVFKRPKLQIKKVEAQRPLVEGSKSVTRTQKDILVSIEIENIGYCDATLGGASLTFSLGKYTCSLQEPSTRTIPVNGSIMATFSVEVSSDSPCGAATIDATASEAHDIGLRQVGDNVASLTDSWIVRPPAKLEIANIVVPSTVHRGEKRVPVDITVIATSTAPNWAAGYFDGADLNFSLGSYENITPPILPVIVYEGTPQTIRYLVDVSTSSPLGPAEINASITYRDINLEVPTENNEGLASPAVWAIVGEAVSTYRDPACTIQASEFNQGNYRVFAKALDMTPNKEFRFRWCNPNGDPVALSNPAILSDASGTCYDELELSSTSLQGAWRVEVIQASDNKTGCVATFTVGTQASAAISLQLPEVVTLGSDFIATLTVTNIGSATILDAEPATLTWVPSNTGTATRLTGPTPARQDVAGESGAVFTYTLHATSTGSFQLQASAFGFDANASSSSYLVTAATVSSNICEIQAEPEINITGLSESYDTVTLGQENLAVSMTIENSGPVGLYIDGASLSHSLASHTQTIASPSSLPFLLEGGEVATFVFHVDVSKWAPTGMNTITGSIGGYEADNPSSRFSVTGGTAGWTVGTFTGVLSANSSYSPAQYSFNVGQTVYAKFFGLIYNQIYRIRIYDPTGTQCSESVTPDPTTTTTIEHSFATTSGTPGTYRVDLIRDGTGGGLQTSLYFTLENAGKLLGELTITPASVDVGKTVTATLFVRNTVASGSTLFPTTPSIPEMTINSSGSLVLVSGPTPASSSITPDFPATFTWVFQAMEDTGTGSLSLIASATGIDINSQVSTSTSAVSNSIAIIGRALAFTPDPIDFGEMDCDGMKTVTTPKVTNTGNGNLTNVTWQPADLSKAESSHIDRENMIFSPGNGFGVATNTEQSASITLYIPYNTPSGNYIATCGVFDDFNPANGAAGIGEPRVEFLASVTVKETKLLVITEDSFDLGSWVKGSAVSVIPLMAFNGGNVNLTNLKFSQTSITSDPNPLKKPITITPSETATLATDGILIAYISTVIDPSQKNTSVIATFTLSSDQATDTFQVLLNVVDKKADMTVTPDPVAFSNCFPNFSTTSKDLQIDNGYSSAFAHLYLVMADLEWNGDIIPAANLSCLLPASIPAGNSGIASLSLYVPAGIPAGTYSGIQALFEDLNDDQLYGSGEPITSFTVQVTVLASGAVDVSNSTIWLGNLQPGSVGTISFLCRNTGSTELNNLKWEKQNLISPQGMITTDFYSLLAPASVAPGAIFIASLGYTIPAGQPGGDYSATSYCWLFDSTDATRDAGEPQDKFVIQCSIGTSSLNIVEDTTQLNGAFPTQTTAQVSYTVTNAGTLTLVKPVAVMKTDLVDGSNTIPKAYVTLSPAVFSTLNPAQNKTGTWNVQVPAGTAVGTYTGTLKAWSDENGNGLPDAGEASDEMTITLGVSGYSTIAVVQESLGLGFIPKGQTKSAAFEIKNDGNTDLTGLAIRAVGAELSPIGAPSFQITTPAAFPSGASFLATLNVSVLEDQGDGGPYSGLQKVYVDINNNSSWDADEPFATFTVTLDVGEKKIDAESPVAFAGPHNPGTSPTASLKLTNTTAIPITNGKLLISPGGSGFPLSEMTISDIPFTIDSGPAEKTCIVTVDIPQFQAPGNYLATMTAFEDDDDDGEIDAFEASDQFDVSINVAEYPLLEIIPTELTASAPAGTEVNTYIYFQVYNAGNVQLYLTWEPSVLSMPGFTGVELPAPSFSCTPYPLNPGVYGTGRISVAPIDVERHPGSYVGNQTLKDYAHAGFAGCSDSVLLTFLVKDPELGAASLYQKVATGTFKDPAPGNRFILSAWICPGSGSAALEFFSVDERYKLVGKTGISIASTSVITMTGSPAADIGIVESRVVKSASYPSGLPWYRTYVAFDYTYDPAIASWNYVMVRNNSPLTASYSVWFDGIQLEKHALSGQKRPTPFNAAKKIILPSSEETTDGASHYYEW